MSEWYDVSQREIHAFAQATGDHYWLHTDPARARSTTFGSTIAHGLFTLSLGLRFSHEIYEIVGMALVVNYGYTKVRFPAPLPVDTRVRMHARLQTVEVAAAGVTCGVLQTFENEGGEKPVCVAEAMIRAFSSPL